MFFMLFVWLMSYVPVPVWFAVSFMIAGCVALAYQLTMFLTGR
jgi:hypothetical protein